MMPKPRLAVVASHPIQYQAPLWRGLAECGEFDLRVYFASDFSVRGYRDPGFGTRLAWDQPLTEGYAHEFLSQFDGGDERGRMLRMGAADLEERLAAFRPSVLLLTSCLARLGIETLLLARRLRVPAVLRVETTDEARDKSGLHGVLRSGFYRAFHGACAASVAIGRNSRVHYLAHGVPASRLGWSPYCVNTPLFEGQRTEHLPARAEARRELSVGEETRLLVYSGKLIPKKDPLVLARAIEQLPEAVRGKLALVVLGSGELQEPFVASVRASLGARLILPGFVNQSRLGRYYAAGDALVLPSAWGETWGLVVNEAMQFGLPVIVSDRVGSHRDLVEGRGTGWVFAQGDAAGLARCLWAFVEAPPAELAERGVRARARVAAYSLDEALRGLRSALSNAVRPSAAI